MATKLVSVMTPTHFKTYDQQNVGRRAVTSCEGLSAIKLQNYLITRLRDFTW